MRGKGSGSEGSVGLKKKEKKKEHIEHMNTHIHSSLLSYCFGRSCRVETPKVIMKFNYNSLGSGMEMSSSVSVSPVAAK